MAAPRFPILIVEVSEAEADLASAELFQLGATGIEVRDATTLDKGKAKPGSETLVASFADEQDAIDAIAALESVSDSWNPRLDAIVGDEWLDEYKKYFHPFELCPGIVVRPPWEAYEAKGGEQVLTLEPGRAFGTGLHETTSLVADALTRYASELRGRTVLDVGTGSGILGLVALLLGAERARAIDVDADAVSVARENAAANHLDSRFHGDTRPMASMVECFPVIVANIEASVLGPMMADLRARADKGALVILSGILAPPASSQVSELLGVYCDFEHVETKLKGEWAALVLRAPT